MQNRGRQSVHILWLRAEDFGVFLVQIEEVLGFARIKPVCQQVELHPLLSQRKLVGTCLRKVRHQINGAFTESTDVWHSG